MFPPHSIIACPSILYILVYVFISFYSWSWATQRLGVWPPHSQKSTNNFWLSQNLITKSLLFNGSIVSINSGLTYFVCHMYGWSLNYAGVPTSCAVESPGITAVISLYTWMPNIGVDLGTNQWTTLIWTARVNWAVVNWKKSTSSVFSQFKPMSFMGQLYYILYSYNKLEKVNC